MTHKKLLEEKFTPGKAAQPPIQLALSPLHKLPQDGKNQSTCLVLLGDSGTGKTHLSCELKHPHGHANHLTSDIRSHLACMHFLSLFNKKQNSLKCFYLHLARSLQDLQTNLVDNKQQKVLIARKKIIKLKRSDFLASIKLKEEGVENEADACEENSVEFDEDLIDEGERIVKSDDMIECIDSMASKFIGNILKPLNNIENSKNYFILVDGIDDSLLQHERLILSNETDLNCDGEMILSFLNKTFLYFPPWLNLILTSKRSTEKSYLRTRLTNIKYEKVSMDKCYNLGTVLTEFNLTNNNNSINQQAASMSSSTTSIHNDASSSSVSENLNHIHSQIHSLMQQENKPSSTSSLNVKNPMELCNAAHFANLKDIQTYILKVIFNILLKIFYALI